MHGYQIELLPLNGKYTVPIEAATFSAWRARIVIQQTSDVQPLEYSIGGPDVKFTYTVPGTTDKVRISYYSCNGVQHMSHGESLEEAGGTWKMWEDLASEHTANPFNVILGGGDDIYLDTDALWELPELAKVMHSVRADRNTETSVCRALYDGTLWKTCLFNRITGFSLTSLCNVLPESAKCSSGKRILHSFLDDQMQDRLTALTRESQPDTFAKCEEEVRAFIFHMYVRHYSRTNVGFSSSLASIPSLKIWDDHDIIDGWGDYSHVLQESEIMQLIYTTAREMYFLFQHQTYEEIIDNNDGFGGDERSGFRKFKIEDPNLFGKPRSEDIKYQSGAGHFLHTIGPTTILGVDCRSERKYYAEYPGASEVFTDVSLEMIFEKLDSVQRDGTQNQHLLVMLGSPLGTPSAAGAERAISCVPVLTAPCAFPLSLFNWCCIDSACAACSACGICDYCVSKRYLNWAAPEQIQTCCGVVDRTPWSFQPGLVDDFQDGWHNPGVHLQRNHLVRGLQEYAEKSRSRVTFLSGDVHFGASAVIKRANFNRDCLHNPMMRYPGDCVCCMWTSVLFAVGCDCLNCYCCRPCAPVLEDLYTAESDFMLMHQFVSSPMANQPTMPPFGLACCALREMSHESSCTSGSTNKFNPCGKQYTLTTDLMKDPNCCDNVFQNKDFTTDATVSVLTQKGTFDPIQLSDVCCCQDALFRKRNWLELEADYAANTDLRVALHVESKQPTGQSDIWSYPGVPALAVDKELVRVPLQSCCINGASIKLQCCSTKACCCPIQPGGPLPKKVWKAP